MKLSHSKRHNGQLRNSRNITLEPAIVQKRSLETECDFVAGQEVCFSIVLSLGKSVGFFLLSLREGRLEQ